MTLRAPELVEFRPYVSVNFSSIARHRLSPSLAAPTNTSGRVANKPSHQDRASFGPGGVENFAAFRRREIGLAGVALGIERALGGDDGGEIEDAGHQPLDLGQDFLRRVGVELAGRREIERATP